MIIDRNFFKFAVFVEDSILTALNKISENRSGIIFAVTEGGVLEGVMSDGDIRRWLTSTETIDLSLPVARIVNRDFVFARIDEDAAAIQGRLDARVSAVPLLDDHDRLVAVAVAGAARCTIGGHDIADDAPTFFIAEIGNNHNGDFNLALRLIDEAAAAGADCAKFQMRDMRELYAVSAESPSADLGAQYTLDLLAQFQLSDDDMLRAFDYADSKGLVPLCTPWDESSFRKLERYGVDAYKIASADFTNHALIETVASAGKPVLCSTGMATEAEVLAGVRFLKGLACPFVLLHCNSTYPAPFKDVNLSYMSRLRSLSEGPVGYSGHERDINVSLAAVALGARVIEKHFTLDRGMEGNDHKVSLLPHEFGRMVEGARQIEEAMGTATERTLSQGEMMNRETLAKSIAAAVDIPAGTPIAESMLRIVSPGQGVQPYRKPELLGRRLHRAKTAGEFFFESDLKGETIAARGYRFPLRWGVPVRYHDLHDMRAASDMDLVEIHLSYKDMDLDFRDFITEPLQTGLVVHAPELFAGDHTLDFCSEDEAYRTRSIVEMQRVIDLTRALTPYFTTPRPCIVTNIGGFSHHGHLDPNRLERLEARFADSLSRLDADGVEIIPQTMPPFPWHFGGQQFHNMFVEPAQIVRLCQTNGLRICFDVSHSKLAANHGDLFFSEVVTALAPHTAHLHLADARGVDGEGLQIGEGEIDWPDFWKAFLALNREATFIPEIWQGHKNGGEGAWRALERLEAHAGA